MPSQRRRPDPTPVVVAAAVVGALALSGALACEPAPLCEVKEAVVVPDGWAFVDPAADALWPAPEGAALCTAEDIQVQNFGVDEAVEVDTRFGCGWATVSQPTLVDLDAGDDVQVRVFYFSQLTFPAAQAEVAIALDGEVVSSTLVDIPSSSGLIAPRLTLTRAVPAGSLAHFHVGNHGDNSWNLIELARISEAECPADAGP